MEKQEEDFYISCKFARSFIFQTWYSFKGSKGVRLMNTIDAILKPLEDKNVDCKVFENVVKNICEYIWKKHVKHKGRKEFIFEKYKSYFIEQEVIQVPKLEVKNNRNNTKEHCVPLKKGRPRKEFSKCCARTQKRRLKLIGNCSLLSSSSKNIRTVPPRKALSLLVEARLTKFQYIKVKNFLDISGSNLPTYAKITEAKKGCYPKKIYISESSAEVELQILLDHTTHRILDSIEKLTNDTNLCATLIGKWGFDGSSGHSEYKQAFLDSNLQDTSLFVTSYVPLQLISESASKSEPAILWENPRPSSTRYCRPIRLQYIKETADVSRNEAQYFRDKISKSRETEYISNGRKIKVNHVLALTMVDGKVCNALTETTSSKCFICNALPNQMNDIDMCLQKPINQDALAFGLSPLHAYIRFYEYFLHISYKLDIQKWQARTEEDREIVSEKKKKVQKELREKLGLIVDKPCAGGSGNSNDGNSARKFFKNYKTSADILKLDEEILRRCYVILRTLSSGYPINSQQFGMFAIETARKLVKTYSWYNLPATVHKILIHGSDVIKHSILGIGELSEEAAEANNKNIKAFRRCNTRKMTRKLTNEDLIKRLLLQSDPYISNMRQLPLTNTSALPEEITNLLQLS